MQYEHHVYATATFTMSLYAQSLTFSCFQGNGNIDDTAIFMNNMLGEKNIPHLLVVYLLALFQKLLKMRKYGSMNLLRIALRLQVVSKYRKYLFHKYLKVHQSLF